MILIALMIGIPLLHIVFDIVRDMKRTKKKNEKNELYRQVDVCDIIKDITKSKKEEWLWDEDTEQIYQTIGWSGEEIEIELTYTGRRFEISYNHDMILIANYDAKDNWVEINYKRKGVIEESFSKEQKEMLKKILGHLNFIYKRFKAEKSEKLKKQQEDEENRKKQQLAEIKNDLQALLKNPKNQHQIVKKGQVSLETYVDGHYFATSVRIENVLYAELSYNQTTNKGNINYIQGKEEHNSIVQSLEKELKQYIEDFPLFYPQDDSFDSAEKSDGIEQESLFNKEMSEQMALENEQMQLEQQSWMRVNERFDLIKAKMEELTAENEWLTSESRHLLLETLVKDLNNLMSMYNKVKNKREIEEDTVESLIFIEEKLLLFEQEIEQEKIRKIRQQKEIIKVR